MSKPKIKLTHTQAALYWDITIGSEIFRMNYYGGTIETKSGDRYFFDTPYFGVTKKQNLYKLSQVECDFEVAE